MKLKKDEKEDSLSEGATNTSQKKQNDNRNIRAMEFLSAYEVQECLWNPALDSYKNKSVRDVAYQQIIKDLESPWLSIRDIKLKIKSIRTTYTKELRLQTKRKHEGKPYNPKLFWFNRANSFLKNVSLSRYKRNNSTSLGKPKLPEENEQLNNKAIPHLVATTTPSAIATTTCIIDYNHKMPTLRRIESINNGLVDNDINSKSKDQTQKELNQNESLYIQHLSQAHADHQQQHNHHHHHHNASETVHRNCIALPSPATTTTTDNADDNTNGVAGGVSDHEDCVKDIIESPHLPNKTDNTSQNEIYNYCTNETNASSNLTITAINLNANGNTEHNNAGGGVGVEGADIGNASGYSNFNNTTAYADSSGLDEYDHFCCSVAAQLRRITDTYSRAFAKFKIQEILFEAETGHYRMNPANTIPVSQNVTNNL